MEKTCVLCSSAIASLANVRSCTESLVYGGVLKSLVYWLRQAAFLIRNQQEEEWDRNEEGEIHNRGEQCGGRQQQSHLLQDLISNCCSAIACISGCDTRSSRQVNFCDSKVTLLHFTLHYFTFFHFTSLYFTLIHVLVFVISLMKLMFPSTHRCTARWLCMIREESMNRLIVSAVLIITLSQSLPLTPIQYAVVYHQALNTGLPEAIVNLLDAFFGGR